MHPSRAILRLVLASLLVSVAAGARPAVASAADSISLEARALVAGRFESEGWAALLVGLENGGEPVTGYVAVDSRDGTARRLVELPAGSRKQVTLYVRPDTFARTMTVRFEDGDGSTLANGAVELRVLERTADNVAIVGDAGGNLRPQLVARASGLPEPVPMQLADLPERPEPLRGLEAMVWAADSGALTLGQRRSLERWVAGGGHLVVLGGPDWQARTAGLEEGMLPVSGLRSVDGVASQDLAAWAGAEAPIGLGGLTASVGSPAEGAVTLLEADGGAAAATLAVGAGRVSFVGIDLATPPFRDWPGAGGLWASLARDNRAASQFIGIPPVEEGNYVIAQALQNLPALEVPPAELLLGVLLAYILLIGPVSYLVLRRWDRRELAWVTAPVLVLVFSAGTYGIGASMKGSAIILNEVAVIRSVPGGSAASVSTYAGLYSPTRSSYDLVARADALFAAIDATGGGTGGTAAFSTEQGDPSRLRGLAVGVFGMQAVAADTTIAYAPSLDISWRVTEQGAAGTVTNLGAEPMEDVAIISQSGGLMIGSLEPGASRDFELQQRNLSGSPASEQVYGFAGVDVASEAGRRTAARRAMIDAIVGYGGVRDALVGMAGGVDRGPYVIGWRIDDPPVGIEVEGQTVQHHSQAVEVLSTRPSFGGGTVTIQPSQTAISVTQLLGQASQPEPGFVVLGNGEVVFRVTLPLEATGMQPTEVRLIAANDAGTILYNQANLGSRLPAGFRLSVLDVNTGDWSDVGDLSRQSRFVLPDPAVALDSHGRILIRISASGLAEEIGQIPVFAGAQVTGVIAR